MSQARAPRTAPPTIDALLRRRAAQSPDAVAIADAANRASFLGDAPRRLTYAEADRAVDAVAARLRLLNLPAETIVGLQLPNIAEHVITLLGIFRAGMIAAPLPLLWRGAEAVGALAQVGAKALITVSRVGTFDHAGFARKVAADVFSIRYVCGFGKNIPDGVVPLDDVLEGDVSSAQIGAPQIGDAARIAAITFDIGSRGVVPVARSHIELIAAGLAVVDESRLSLEAGVLSAIVPSSFGGMILSLAPWLLTGGPLVLHYPFDAGLLLQQRRQERCGALVIPGPLAFRLAETGAFAVDNPTMIAAWRSPERLPASPAWREPDVDFVDVSIFGEVALIPARRSTDGRPRSLAARDKALELRRSEAGTLMLRGALLPHRAFPPGIERSRSPHVQTVPDGWIDTGYACTTDSITGGFVVTGAPVGIVTVGGYRFPLNVLADAVKRIDGAATLFALPDPVIGQRLVGNASNRGGMQAALAAAGANPLVVAAFRDQAGRDQRAAGAY